MNIKLAGVMVAIGIILGFYLVNCRWYEDKLVLNQFIDKVETSMFKKLMNSAT
ncbi:hypothetical protein [Orientia tsutsugamushi]|uniref:hypothetical protein n=1 Tax=Orientia tsutsugamushi TaxID=784 RepID=UPI000B2301DF